MLEVGQCIYFTIIYMVAPTSYHLISLYLVPFAREKRFHWGLSKLWICFRKNKNSILFSISELLVNDKFKGRCYTCRMTLISLKLKFKKKLTSFELKIELENIQIQVNLFLTKFWISYIKILNYNFKPHFRTSLIRLPYDTK